MYIAAERMYADIERLPLVVPGPNAGRGVEELQRCIGIPAFIFVVKREHTQLLSRLSSENGVFVSS